MKKITVLGIDLGIDRLDSRFDKFYVPAFDSNLNVNVIDYREQSLLIIDSVECIANKSVTTKATLTRTTDLMY